MAKPIPDFYYSREHDNPAGWAVRGPHRFKMYVPDKTLCAAIAEMMNGDWDKAKSYMDGLALWDGEIVKLVAANSRR